MDDNKIVPIDTAKLGPIKYDPEKYSMVARLDELYRRTLDEFNDWTDARDDSQPGAAKAQARAVALHLEAAAVSLEKALARAK